MEQITVKVPSETAESLAEYSETQHDGNRSEAARELLAKGLAFDDRIDALETERDRLQRQLRATTARQEDVGELVEYVDEQRSLERRRTEREERRRSANVLQRAWWFVAGEPEPHPIDDGGGEGARS